MPRVKLGQGRFIDLPNGYRTISKSDINAPFKPPKGKMREYPLRYFYEWSQDKNNIVIIKKSSGKEIEGIGGFRNDEHKVYGRSLTVEMLSRNSLVNSGGNVAKGLVDVAVKWLAPQIMASMVLVESINDLKEFYEDLGFKETGESFYDDYWGEIHILRISVSSG